MQLSVDFFSGTDTDQRSGLLCWSNVPGYEDDAGAIGADSEAVMIKVVQLADWGIFLGPIFFFVHWTGGGAPRCPSPPGRNAESP